MATGNGLVCYNGYSFRSFTTKDGLPDNEVFGLYEDIYHRLWMKPFAKEICYMWKGRIYNRHNDEMLKKVKLHNIAQYVVSDRWGNVFASESNAITCISPTGEVKRITQLDGQSLYYLVPRLDTAGRLLALSKNKLYRYQRDHFELVLVLPESNLPDYIEGPMRTFITESLSWTPPALFLSRYNCNSRTGLYFSDVERARTHYFGRLSDTSVILATSDGIHIKNLFTGKLQETLLDGYDVACAMHDKEGNLWAGTLGQGVFRISRSPISSIPLSKASQPIRFLQAGPKELILSSDDGMLALVRHTGARPALLWERPIDPAHAHELCTYAGRNSEGRWVINQGGYFRLYTSSLKPLPHYAALHVYSKTVMEEGKDQLLVGTPVELNRVDTRRLQCTDTLLQDRITAVTKLGKIIYAGTLNGLFMSDGNQQMTPCTLPELTGHIAALYADSLLWVANNNATLIILDHDKALARITSDNGLVCNHIFVIKSSKNLVWIGTDEGLYALTKSPPFRIVRHLSERHGLNSNEIHHLEVTGGTIWAASSKGLNYFKEQDVIPVKQQASFLVTTVQNEDVVIPLQQQPLTLNKKTLRIDFDVIDHSGISKPGFAYRLNEGKWTELDNSSLYFPTLPYGDFVVFLRATSPEWEAPKIIQIAFYRPPPLYLRWWFVLLLTLSGAAVLAYLARRYLQWESRKEKERLLVQQNLLQLEQLALQGQMNAHFIFNCITAIRQHYNKGDLARANRFVDAFSALIRTAFEMVNQTFTSLDKELRYLGQYLRVEQERFNHSFSFTIKTELAIRASQVPVPTMLLQPLVENAIKHGVRSLPDGLGAIQIGIKQQEGWISITIEDNGPGRKRNQHIDETGRPIISITSTTVNQKRIDILNQLFDGLISMQTTDIPDPEGHIAGTRVTLTYPLNIYELTV